MVLEDLFKIDLVRHRPCIATFFSFIFTFISFFIAFFLFKESMSVATVFLITILLVPAMVLLIKEEEKKERKYGLKHFFRNHKDIFEIYLYSFIGVFAAFLVIGFSAYGNQAVYNNIFDFQIDFLASQQGIGTETVQGFVDGAFQQGFEAAVSIFFHDLLVVLICFVLSFFFGASAIFLIILNGSVFANFIVLVVKTIADNFAQGMQAFLFFLIHLLPEISGFMIAAIAGGVVSKAVLYEKKGSVAFRNVFKDAAMLMLIAIGLVLVAAILEVFVTARLFQAVF